MDPNVDWNEIGNRIAQYLKLLEYGAYASILAALLSIADTVILIVLLVQLNNRLPRPPRRR